jgi:hypothetical protein
MFGTMHAVRLNGHWACNGIGTIEKRQTGDETGLRHLYTATPFGSVDPPPVCVADMLAISGIWVVKSMLAIVM